MAKRLILTAATSLPHARIYLDDVETILHLVRDVMNTTRFGAECSFTFEVEQRQEMTTMEELKEYGGSVSKFTIMVEYTPAHLTEMPLPW